MSSTKVARPPSRRPTFARGVRVQIQVLNGLVLRELAARFGRRGAGLIFTFISPMAQASIIAILRVVVGAPGYAGMATFPFTACGVLYYRAFRTMAGDQIDAVPRNNGLLYFHKVTTLDIYFATFLVNLAINLSVGGLMYITARLTGYSPPADEPLYLILLLILSNILGFSFGLTLASVSIFFPAIKAVNQIFMRIMYFTSGVFFVVPEIPPFFRGYLLWNPLLHVTELARSFYFIQYQTAYGDLDYVLRWTVALLVTGLVLERILRDQVVK
ncbi:MAG: ABC transporter permease [Rhodospirillales bacterium]